MSLIQRRKGCFCALAAAAIFFAAPAADTFAAWPSGPDSLLILHTNDIHAHLLPFEDAKGAVVGGSAARAALIARLRGAPSRTLLLDAGDVFQGSPFYNFFRGVPDYQSMTLMGFDAGAFGNHELDDGPAAWLRVRPKAAFPILTANVFVAADSAWASSLSLVAGPLRKGATWVGGARVAEGAPLRYLTTPYLIRDVGGIKVAILGLTTKDIISIVGRSNNAGVAASDPVAIAKILVPELRRKADFVIALTHIGVDEDRRLASRVPGIDVIVGGHSHTYLWAPIFISNGNANGYKGTAIVQAGRWGDRVGRMAIAIGPGGVKGLTDALIPVRPSDGEDRRVVEMLQPFRDSISTLMDKPVFQSPARIPSSGLEDGDTPLGNFVADVIHEAGRGDIGLINSGGIRAPLPKGTITVGDIFTVLPFDNTVVTVPMKGWQVRELFDFIARRVGKRGFAQISGAQFAIRRGRAADIRVGGRPLESDRVYRVATIDYLYTGGDGYTMFEKAGVAEGTGRFTRDAAVDFLRTHPDYEFKKRGRIRWEGGIPSRDLIYPPR